MLRRTSNFLLSHKSVAVLDGDIKRKVVLCDGKFNECPGLQIDKMRVIVCDFVV